MMNKPPGWSTLAKIIPSLPNDLGDLKWKSLVSSYPTDLKGKISDEVFKHLENGCVAVNPMLFYSEESDKHTKLAGVHCAYINADFNVESCMNIVKRLLMQGVKAFSIYIPSHIVSISEFFDKLEKLINDHEVYSKEQPVSFTVWLELHCKRTLEKIAETANIDPLAFANSRNVNSKGEKETSDIVDDCEEKNNTRLTIGVLVPKLFFEFLSQNKDWYFYDGEASKLLSVVHCNLYNKTFMDLITKSEGAIKIESKKLFSMLLRATVANNTKFLVLLRDSCHSLNKTSFIWNEDIKDAPIFPNHLGEVPLVCNGHVYLQFAAFVNAERTAALGVSNSYCVSLAYMFLKEVLNNHMNSAKHHVDDGEPIFGKGNEIVKLTSAVGIIGLHDSIGYNDSDEESNIVSRPVYASDIERVIVPLIKDSHLVFPMSGTLVSVLWQVSCGSWTSHIPFYLMSNPASKESIIIPNGAFARFCHENNVSLDNVESVRKASERFNKIFSEKVHSHILSTRTEAQIHQMRKVCSSFGSTTSMPLVLTFEEAASFTSPASFLTSLARIVIKNANNDCPVLLPEIRTTLSDMAFAKNCKYLPQPKLQGIDSISLPLYKCFKRKRASIVSAVSVLDNLLDTVTSHLHNLKSSTDVGISPFALNLLHSLLSSKMEEIV